MLSRAFNSTGYYLALFKSSCFSNLALFSSELKVLLKVQAFQNAQNYGLRKLNKQNAILLYFLCCGPHTNLARTLSMLQSLFYLEEKRAEPSLIFNIMGTFF
jgi:hypothetical protein